MSQTLNKLFTVIQSGFTDENPKDFQPQASMQLLANSHTFSPSAQVLYDKSWNQGEKKRKVHQRYSGLLATEGWVQSTDSERYPLNASGFQLQNDYGRSRREERSSHLPHLPHCCISRHAKLSTTRNEVEGLKGITLRHSRQVLKEA